MKYKIKNINSAKGKKLYYHGFKGFCLAFIVLIATAACSDAADRVPSQPVQISALTETVASQPESTHGFITVTGGNSLPEKTVIVSGSKTTNSSVNPTISSPNQTVLKPPGEATTVSKPPFDRFVDAIKNGKKKQVVGVYVEHIMALRVVQQPSNNPSYVSTLNGVATQFLLAFQVAGNIGMLAHNYLAGSSFFKLKPGDLVEVVYGDASVEEFEISVIHRYQALSPRSPTSDFIDQDTGDRISANTLFYRMYAGNYHLTMQTCIQEGIEDSWGRLFVIATPL